ncbi:MAG: hypothetical protein IPP90_09185 [Gemmatimonadaceae bacterium]|nr:hypothetical protein [Gemmatimonadaceae bacterium]
MRARVRDVASVVLLAIGAATASAQPVRRMPLKPANATLDAEFVGITSLREVADGRVIVTDGRDQQLYLADFKGNSASVLGRKGKGPGEWLNVGFVQALSGDSSIMGDFGNGRMLLFDGARIVGLVPPDHPSAMISLSSMSGADRFGHLLGRKEDPADAAKLEFTRADSSALVLVALSTGRLDTVAKLRQRPRRVNVILGSDGKARGRVLEPSEPNAQEEIARLFADGWIAVVRLEPLRVDWRSPDRRWTQGAPFPLRPMAVDARERKAIEARRAQSREETRKMGMPERQFPPLPTSIPVMAISVVLRETPDGRLLIRRSTSEADPAVRYLVINRAGTIDGEIVVSARADIIGFGPRSIYIAFKDDDDIQRLRRHPWP